MSEPTKVKARLLDAKYVKEAKSVLMLLECEQGRFTSQIHRDNIATFGARIEEEIEKEMQKYVDILKYVYKRENKYINAVFDPDLDKRLKQQGDSI